MVPKKRYLTPRSPGTLIYKLSSNYVSLITSVMSHRYLLTRSPTLRAPLFALFCPFLFFPIHVYSSTLHPFPPPSFSHGGVLIIMHGRRRMTVKIKKGCGMSTR